MNSFSYLEAVCCSMYSYNCCFLTCIQISQEAGQVVCYSHLFQNFPQFNVIHTVKGFGIVNKAEIDVFLELSCFFDDPADVGDWISGSSAFSKTSLNIWKFTIHVLLKPGLENFEHCFTSMWDECRLLEKTLEGRLDCKEIQPVYSEGDQPWDFFGRNDAKAETPVLWPPHVKFWLIGKDSDAGRDWGQEERGTTEDEMAGWHHWLNGH